MELNNLLTNLKKAAEAAAGTGLAPVPSSRTEERYIVCHKCRKAPGTLVKVLGFTDAAGQPLSLYQCSGSCSEQADKAISRLFSKKKQNREARQQRTARPLPMRVYFQAMNKKH